MSLVRGLGAVLLSACLGGCVSLADQKTERRESADALAESQDKNDRLTVDRDAQADKNVDLALRNHYLKIDNDALTKQGLDRDAFYDSVTRDLRQQVADGRLRITRKRDALILDVSDEILFDSGKADLRDEGREVLKVVSQALAKGLRTVRVVGHTDDRPLSPGAAFATNWELSTARATKVVRFLQEEGGLDPRRLLAAGRAQWDPVDTNKTAAGRQRNRRIAIMLIDQDLFD
jgi:chemotaxis protein MotB